MLKHIFLSLCLLSYTLPSYAATKEHKVIVNKKPIKNSQQKAVVKQSKNCYNAYDKRTKQTYVLCK